MLRSFDMYDLTISVGFSMQGIIPDILQCMKSESHLIISAQLYQEQYETSIILAQVYQGDKTSVISARVYQGDETRAISARMYQGDKTSAISARTYQGDETSGTRHGWIRRIKGQREQKDRWFEDINTSDSSYSRCAHHPYSLCIRTSHFPCIQAPFFPPPTVPSPLDYKHMYR